MNNLALKRRASENFVDDEMNESASRKNKASQEFENEDVDEYQKSDEDECGDEEDPRESEEEEEEGEGEDVPVRRPSTKANIRVSKACRERQVKGQGANSKKLWGRMFKEFGEYCSANAGDNLNGVIMNSDKRPLDGTLNPETVDSFFMDYLSVRKVKSGAGKGKNHMSAKSLECFSEALSNEKKNQVAHEPGRFASDYEKTLSVHSKAVKTVIQERKHAEHKERDEDPEYDRTTDFRKQDSYTPEEFNRISKYGLTCGGLGPGRNQAYTTAMVHSICMTTHDAIERTGDICTASYSDAIVTTQPQTEGRTKMESLAVATYPKHAKGKKEYVTLIANVDGYKCTFVAFGLNLFIVFGLEGQPEPNYGDPRDWKRLKFFPGKLGSRRGSSGKTDPYTSVKSAAMSAPITKMKKALKITAPKVLHGGRRSGSQHLQARLTSHAGIDGRAESKAHGSWAGDHFSSSYQGQIASIPGLRSQAGVSPFGGGYDIPRIDILSRDLVHDIMPRAVEALAAQEALPVHQRDNNLLKGTEAIVLVLSHLIAFVASEFDSFTGHWLLQHKVFKSERFYAYRRQQQLHIANFTGVSSGSRALALLEGQQGPVVAALRELAQVGMRAQVHIPTDFSRQGDSASISSSSSIFSNTSISPSTRKIASVHSHEFDTVQRALFQASFQRSHADSSHDASDVSTELRPQADISLLSSSSTQLQHEKSYNPVSTDISIHPKAWLHAFPIDRDSTSQMQMPFIIPEQALSVNYKAGVTACTSVETLASHWFGTDTVVGIRELEIRFGECKPGVPHGCSWRSKKLNFSHQSVTSLYSAMNAIYHVLDGAATAKTINVAVDQLQAKIDQEFHGKAQNFSHLTWLSAIIKADLPGAEARSKKMKMARLGDQMTSPLMSSNLTCLPTESMKKKAKTRLASDISDICININDISSGTGAKELELFMRPLSLTDSSRVRTSWNSSELSERVAVTQAAGFGGSSVDILEKHLRRLATDRWLEDETVNGIMFLIQKLDQGICARDPKRAPSYIFSSFFFTKMFEDGTFSYESVRRWCNKIECTNGNVFKLDRLIIPTHVSLNHWALCIAHMPSRRLQYYDSYVERGKAGNDNALRIMNGLKLFLKEEANKYTDDPSVSALIQDIDSWEIVPTIVHETPQQDNDNDCGVFTCMFAYCLILGSDFRFSCRDISKIRERLSLNLLDGQIG